MELSVVATEKREELLQIIMTVEIKKMRIVLFYIARLKSQGNTNPGGESENAHGR